MPPFWWNRYGKLAPSGGGGGGGGLAGTSISKDLIADQTWERLSSDLLLSGNWAFDAVEGLGTLSSAATVGHILAHGEGNDIRVTTEWTYVSGAANTSFGVIGRMPTYINPDDFYYWVRIYNESNLRLSTSNGGTANLDTVNLTWPIIPGNRFQLIHEITNSTTTQDHVGTFKGEPWLDNNPGAATYNLSGIAAGADTDLTVIVDRGAPQVITFTAGDFANYAACTPAEVSAVMTASLVGARTFLWGNIIFLASTGGYGATYFIEAAAGPGNNANGVLGFDEVEYPGDLKTVSGSDATYNYGFIGFRSGFSGVTGQWLRYIEVEYLT